MNHKKTIVSITLVAVSLCYGAVLNACYIDLSAKDIEPYIGHTIKYYKEHKVEILEKGEKKIFSFPVEHCTALPLEEADNIKWFFSSAVDGKVALFGRAIEVLNLCITNVYAVRARTNFGCIQIYFGCNASKPKFNNATWTVYEGNILYIHALFKKNSAITHVHFSKKNAQYLSHKTITTEIRKHISDCDCNSFEFWQAYGNIFCKNGGGYHALSGCLVSSLCYWAAKQSKLKEIECDKK